MLVCLVTLEMERDGRRRVWRDVPESRDWEGLSGFKQRDGWKVISHRREFIEVAKDEKKDAVELSA